MIDEFLEKLRADGRSTIHAIRGVRAHLGCSLTEAREIVDANGGWVALHDSSAPDVLRDAVLRALDHIPGPMAADDLAMVVALTQGIEVTEAALAELAAADREAYLAGEDRPVWLCPALEYPDGEPNDEFFTRSDVRVRNRTVRGVLPETQELWLLWRFCYLVLDADPVPELAERIDDLTIHLPAARVAERLAERDETVPGLEVYQEVAEDRYTALVRQEHVAHQHVYEALEALPEAERLFGRA